MAYTVDLDVCVISGGITVKKYFLRVVGHLGMWFMIELLNELKE